MFADDIILYIESPRLQRKKPQKPYLNNKFRKISGYKITTKTSWTLHTNKEVCIRNQENNPIYHSIKNNNIFIFRNKFNQGGERSVTIKAKKYLIKETE